jgi:hypothetical protein
MAKKSAAKIRPKTFVKNMAAMTGAKQNDPLTNSIRYYTARLAHKWAMLTLVGSTIIYWVFLVTTSTAIYFANQTGVGFKDSESTNRTIGEIQGLFETFVLRWAILFVLGTLALLAIKRFRSYEKPQLVDSLIIAIYCLGSVALSQQILRYFLQNYVR